MRPYEKFLAISFEKERDCRVYKSSTHSSLEKERRLPIFHGITGSVCPPRPSRSRGYCQFRFSGGGEEDMGVAPPREDLSMRRRNRHRCAPPQP